MKKHLYILLFILPLIGFGQGWEQTFEEPGISNSVQQTSDGGYIITGNTYSNDTPYSPRDICLIKTDENGNE